MACNVVNRLCLFHSHNLKPVLASKVVNSYSSVIPRHIQACAYSVQPKAKESSSKYKVVVVGGGSGGCSVAAKFASSLGSDLAIVEPNDTHYYQPIWTLVGAGLKDFKESGKPMAEVLPEACTWIKEKAMTFDPENNCLELASGEKVHYDYLVLSLGLQLNYDQVPGLEEALAEDPTVASNYHPKYVQKTNPALQSFKGGNAIFTFPNSPIKCAGAPQKIMYLADEIFRKNGVRDNTKVLYNSSLPVIFGVKKYATALLDVIKQKGIDINFRHSLSKVDHKNRTATFDMLDEGNKPVEFTYDFLHATPPMSAPTVLKSSPLANEAGFVSVDKQTLQHDKFPNVFSLGDCSNLPTAKTAAAVASQCGIVHKNLSSVMEGKSTTPMYDGYTSCPLVTSSKTCILAEFDFDAQPLETFPFNQGVERGTTYQMKANMMPPLYWNMMLKGKWNGPKTLRKVLHLGMSK